METIVVGVDGSAGARKALRFAAREASLRGARLRVLCAWEVPGTVYSSGIPLSEDALDSFRAGAEEIVAAALEEARQAQPGLDCEGLALEGHAAELLIDEAERASLVVVGNRGHGGFASLLLGSVSQQVVHHASCPVAVVPHEDPAE